jgi:hypothetical protein
VGVNRETSAEVGLNDSRGANVCAVKRYGPYEYIRGV